MDELLDGWDTGCGVTLLSTDDEINVETALSSALGSEFEIFLGIEIGAGSGARSSLLKQTPRCLARPRHLYHGGDNVRNSWCAVV